MTEKKIRPIAIYLPQYHPIEENDKWWGKGFTEWTNVTKAKPLRKDHYQPHLPSDLGFYDLRVSETRFAQAELAKEYGIYGFCYYHYWFNGKRIMERPFNEVFESGSPDFPFMLCWANENWTRVWDGGSNNILLEQNYTEEDALNHIKTLIPYFLDSRYIKIEGKPVFAIYRSTDIPNIDRMIDIWRSEASKYDIELYLCRFETFQQKGKDFLKVGFDAAIEFQPEYDVRVKSFYKRVLNKIKGQFIFNKYYYTPYKNLVIENLIKNAGITDYKRYRCVCPGWDNTSRRKINPIIFYNSTPELFYEWTSETIKQFTPYSDNENLFFINAWNEWAEGNHLEPDLKWGKAYLEALSRALNEVL